MLKRTYLCIIFFVASFGVADAFAARTFTANGMANRKFIGSSIMLKPVECQTLIANIPAQYKANASCIGLDEAVASTASFAQFQFKTDLGVEDVSLTVSGTCTAGAAAGETYVPLRYVNSTTLQTVQVIRGYSQVTGSVSGCKVQGSDEAGCFYYSKTATVSLAECNVKLKETGDVGGADGMGDTSAPEYTGDGTGGGGGTTPGDGGGTTPGDGGGTTPGGGGTTPGDGGTTPGDGGGGTTPGGGGTTPGGGGTGDTQAHCGAPGQPACAINEGNTPTGIGGLMDGLMKLVEGIGEGRETGLDDAKSDSGKNTSLSFVSVSVPTGVCVNPTVSLPNIAGSWSVDVCQYVGILGVAFDALWAFAFVVGVISLVGRATAKPVA